MKILITGGSGFIGTVLAGKLKDIGHDITIYDKVKSNQYPEDSIVADVRDVTTLKQSLNNIDAVYHLAAEHRDDVTPISLYNDVNVGGAKKLVEAAEYNKVKKIIFTSSVAVYALNSGCPNEESPVEPFNEYGKSKYEAEIVFNDWLARDKDRSLVILRPSVVFGESNRGNVFNLMNTINQGVFYMVGKGENKKSMSYVQNISDFLVYSLGIDSGIFNYADKPDLSTSELVTFIRKYLGKESKNNLRIPYIVGLFAGFCFDVLAKLTKKKFPVSVIRIKKFCATTTVDAAKVKQTGFVAMFSMEKGVERMIKNEF